MIRIGQYLVNGERGNLFFDIQGVWQRQDFLYFDLL